MTTNPQWGLTPAGWVGKPLTQIQAEIDARLQAILGTSSGTNPDGTIPLQSRAGQLKTLLTDAFSGLWDLLQALVAQLDPNQATGAGLAVLSSLTGTVQQPAAYSVVLETLTGIPGTVVPAGSLAALPSTGAQFRSGAGVTLAAATPWQLDTTYSAADRRTNSSQIYVCTSPGRSAVSGSGPSGVGAVPYVSGQAQTIGDLRTIGGTVYVCTTGGLNGGVLNGTQTGTGIVDGSARWTRVGAGGVGAGVQDGTVIWQWVGVGTAFADVLFQATVTGPIGADAGQLTRIMTPVFGWQGCCNLTDASVGALLETSAALRLRRELELHSSGGPPVDGIRRAVLEVAAGEASVTTCQVYANRTDATSDGVTPPNIPAGMPPHSVMVLADYLGAADNPALDQAIAQAIRDTIGGGIDTTFASATGSGYAFTSTVTDSQGNAQTVRWARPRPTPIYVEADVTYDSTPGVFPGIADAEVLVKGGVLQNGSTVVGAIPTYGQSYPAGRNVWASALASAIFDGPTDVVAGAQPLPGVLDASVKISTSPGPSGSSPITIDALHRAQFESTNITVVLTPSAP